MTALRSARRSPLRIGMATLMASAWRPLALRSAVSVGVGLALFAGPGRSLFALVVMCGLYLLVDGALTIAAAGWQPLPLLGFTLLLEGLIGLALGFSALLWTEMTSTVLGNLLVVWALPTGALELFAAARLRDEPRAALALTAAGVASITFGALLAIGNHVGTATITTALGGYALLFGLLVALLTLRLRAVALVTIA